jgi:alanyl-tRNA synthetase
VEVRWTTQTKALEEGAIAFFGDKYENDVRTINIGDHWSFELCGGTHMSATGGIGAFFITAEFSIGSGLRRIEAQTGKGAEAYLRERFGLLERLSGRLRVPVAELGTRLEAQITELEEARRTVARLEREALLGGSAQTATEQVQDVDGVRLIVDVKQGANAKALRDVGDHLRDRLGSGIVVVGSVVDDRPTVIAMVTKDLVAQGYSAGDIVREVAKRMGGGGGGRADVAQAGGRDASQMEAALAAVPEIVRAVQPAGADGPASQAS